MVLWENKLVNMEKLRTSAEVRQKEKEREKIVEHAEGSLPVKKQYLKLPSIFFSNLGAKKKSCFNEIF